MKKFILSAFIIFYINAWSQSWLPVGGAYQLCQSPCLGNSNTNADTDLALNNANQPYVFYANSVFGDGDKMVKKFENGNWSNVGNINFTAACVEPSIDISNDGTPFVAYQNIDGRAEVRSLNGPSWQLLGTAGFSPDLANGITIRVNSNNEPYVAYADGSQLGKMTVKKYNLDTAQWETVGTEGFSTSSATYVDFEIASNNDLYVAYIDGDVNFGELPKMCVKKFDGTNWVSVGMDRFTSENIYYSSFALDNNNVPYVIYTDLDETLPKLSVQKFNGSTWEYVGTSRFSSTETSVCDITFDINNKPNIVYKKPNYDNDGFYTHDSLSSMVYESGSWQFVGVQNFSPWSNTNKPCIEIGSNNIAYISDEQSYFDLNTNLIVGGYVSYFGTTTSLIDPSLASVSQYGGVNCSTDTQTIKLSGMQPNSTSTIEYNINGVVQPNITNLLTYSDGYTYVNINLPLNLSGQTLTITKVIRTDIVGTTDLICSISTIVQCNANITYYQDSDGDGLGDPTQTYQSCEGQPLNYVANNTDCDALNPNGLVTFSNPTPSVCSSGNPVLLSFINNPRPISATNGGCLNASYGKFPSDDYTPTILDGVTPNIILTNGYAGEYSVVNVVPNTKYLFISERYYNDSYGANSQNDQVTISTIDGSTILASGQYTALWQSTGQTKIRFYSHANYNFQNNFFVGPCGTESFSRTRSIICSPTTIPQTFSWTPTTGLFTDAAGTIPYTGTAVTSVYAKPNQNTTYSLTSVNGCGRANAITVVVSDTDITYYQDADGDGFGNPAISQQSCAQPSGYVSNNTDCDDANSLVFFTQLNYIDLDQDGYTNGTILLCRGLGEAPVGYTYSSNGPDCDDTNPNFHDNTITYYQDNDGDSYGNNEVSQVACIAPAGYVTNGTDCNDTDPNINIGGITYFQDLDGDGFGNNFVSVISCFVQSGYVINNLDCDDTNPAITVPINYYEDIDGDGYGTNNIVAFDCVQPDGFVLNNTDCDDSNPLIFNSSTLYQDFDNDGYTVNNVVLCYGVEIPSGYKTAANGFDCNDFDPNKYFEQLLYIDSDQDGYDDGSTPVCRGNIVPLGYSENTNGPDCIDFNNQINVKITIYIDNDNDGYDNGSILDCPALGNEPGYSLSTLGLDCNDNDNQIQQQFETYYQDSDGDGYGNSFVSQNACSLPVGYSVNFLDCNDSDPNVFQAVLFFVDSDNDGYSTEQFIIGCQNETAPVGYVIDPLGTDCDDSNPNITSVNTNFYQDADGDGFGNPVISQQSCTQPVGYVLDNTDCDDSNATVNPSAPEVAYDGLDNNCDGNFDEGFPPLTTTLNITSCNSTLANIYNSINANYPISGVTGYRFEITDTTNPSNPVQTIDRTVHWFTLTLLSNYNYATTYSIRVMVKFGAAWVGYYGDPCTVTTPSVAAAFGASSLVSPVCGSTLAAVSSSMNAKGISGATGYRFKVTRGTEEQTLDRIPQWFQLRQLTTYVYGATYSVEVAFKTTAGYGAFGPVCTIVSPIVPTITSCGATVAASGQVTVPVLAGVTQYTYEVTGPSGVQLINRTTAHLPVSLITGYSTANTYSIRVAVMSTGVMSDFGAACSINPSGSARFGDATATSTSTITGTEFKAVGYPNPFETNFTLNVTTTSDENVQVAVYDIIGRQVESKEVNAADANVLEVGSNYPSGVYNVVVSQGKNVKSLRMIKR